MSERKLPPSTEGSVVLNVGGDIGALVLHTSAAMVDREIDLVPDDPARRTTHSAVRERRVGAAHLFAAVYPDVPSGWYAVEGSQQRVEIVGGRITEVVYALDLQSA